MKPLIIIALLLSLSGCAQGGLFKGATTSTVVVAPDGTVPTDRLGRAYRNKTTASKSDQIFSHAADAIASLPDEVDNSRQSCGGITFKQMLQLSASAQATIGQCLAAAEANRPIEIMGKALANATSKYQSDAHAIFAEAANAVKAVQQGAVDKWRSATGSVSTLGIVTGVASAVKSFTNSTRDIAVAGVENAGNTTVGNISVSGSQTASADSNDGLGGADGEGVGGAGSGSGVASNDRNGTETNIISIGNRGGSDTNNSVASDDAISNSGTTGTQNAEPSATQNLNFDGTQKGQTTADEQNGQVEVDDSDGTLDF